MHEHADDLPRTGSWNRVSVLGWMTVVGALLLFMALLSSPVQRLPISTSFIYLMAGIAIGPLGFGWLSLDVESQREGIEVLTEIAVIISLFVGGLKLRLPLRDASWWIALRLAGPVMMLSIAGTALVAHLLLAVPPATALLLGALLAPTDPVLASAVSVDDAADHDRVRYSLSGEAGLNDGAAFPFVVLALAAMRNEISAPYLGTWFLSRIVWAIPVGIVVGYWIGRGLGRLSIALRSRQRDTGAPSDFLALAIIALSFVCAERLHAWGFLAAFAAGVGLRHAEVGVVAESPNPSLPDDERVRLEHVDSPAHDHPPAESLVSASVSSHELEQPAVAAGVLIAEALTFGDTLERLLEVMLVVLVGIALADVWYPPALLFAAVLFLVVRPLAVSLLLVGSGTSRGQRALIGWFGIRGIGSLYYLSYALSHGVGGPVAMTLVKIVVTVVACSIVVHGISVTPILARYERALAAKAS